MAIKIEELEHLSTTEILNIISGYFGDSLMEKIIDFCETEDIDVQYLGDILEEDEDFKKLLHNDCFAHHSIIDNDLEHRDDTLEKLDIW